MRQTVLLLCLMPVFTAVAGETPTVKREIIPGSELMTSQERERYRQRIRGAATPQDEEKVRAEHVKQMQERARLRGLQLADPAAQRAVEK